MRRPAAWIGPVAIAALSVAGFAFTSVAPAAAEESLTAFRSGLFLEPWRAVSSLFVHYSAPHLVFNLVTGWLLGVHVAERHGAAAFLGAFLGPALVGQTVHTLLGPGHVYGISGGVCGLYGFLLSHEQKSGLRAMLRNWPMSWAYPAALLGLFLAELTLGLPVANVNHVVGIATGWALGRGFEARAGALWRVAAVAPVALSAMLTVYRPWDPVWRAIRAPDAGLVYLTGTSCDLPLSPPSPDVASAPPVTVTLLNPMLRAIALEYVAPDGTTRPSLRTTSAARSFLPLEGSVWRVRDREGSCLLQFLADRSGALAID